MRICRIGLGAGDVCRSPGVGICSPSGCTQEEDSRGKVQVH